MFDVIEELRRHTATGAEPCQAVERIAEELGYTTEAHRGQRTVTQSFRIGAEVTVGLSWTEGDLGHVTCATAAARFEASRDQYGAAELTEIAVAWLADGVGLP